MQVQTGSDGWEPLVRSLARCVLFFFLPTDCCSTAAAADPDKSNKVGENWQAQAARLLAARLVPPPDAARHVPSPVWGFVFFWFVFFRAARRDAQHLP